MILALVKSPVTPQRRRMFRIQIHGTDLRRLPVICFPVSCKPEENDILAP
jgi:hypothetical protein